MARAKPLSNIKVKHGALHHALGIPVSQKIPMGKLIKAAHSHNKHVQKMANLAETFAKYRPGHA